MFWDFRLFTYGIGVPWWWWRLHCTTIFLRIFSLHFLTFCLFQSHDMISWMTTSIYAAAFPSIHTYTHTRPFRKYFYNFFFYFRATWNYWKFSWYKFLLAFCDSSISFVHLVLMFAAKTIFVSKQKHLQFTMVPLNYSWILFFSDFSVKNFNKLYKLQFYTLFWN